MLLDGNNMFDILNENLNNDKIITSLIKYNGEDADNKPSTEKYTEYEHLKRAITHDDDKNTDIITTTTNESEESCNISYDSTTTRTLHIEFK